jgi:hypothetical protein
MNQVDIYQVFVELTHAKMLYQMRLNTVQILMLSYLEINHPNYIKFHHAINHKNKNHKKPAFIFVLQKKLLFTIVMFINYLTLIFL